ncbi:MAG: efflux RND transporter permease subunit [Bdellovibrionales bacterium]
MSKKHFTHKFIDSPWKTILFSLVLLFALSAGVSKLYANFGYRVWFQETNPNLIEFDAFERKFGSDEVALVAVHSPDGIFDSESINLIKDLTDDLWQSKDAIRVDSITNYNWVHADADDILVEPLIPEESEDITPLILKEREKVALEHNVIPDYLINRSAQTALIYVNLKPSIDEIPDYKEIVGSLRKIIRKYQILGAKEGEQKSFYVDADYDTEVKEKSAGKTYGANHTFHLTGNPALTFSFQESSQADMQKIVPFVFLFTLLFLFILFRRITGVLLPLVVIGVTIFATLGFSGWIGIEMNVLTAIVPQFLIALSIAVAVHVLSSFYQFLDKGLDKRLALKVALEKNWIPTILTSISTAIGFLSFSTSGIPPIAKMGIMSAFGTMFAWLITFTLIAPLLSFLPLKRKKDGKRADDTYIVSERSERFTNFIYNHSKKIVLIFTVFAFGCAYLASSLVASSDPFEYFEKSNPIRVANEFIEEELGGITGVEMMIHSGVAEGIKDPEFLGKVEGFQKWIEDKQEFTSTISIVDILKEMNQVLNGSTKESYVLPDTKDGVAQQLFLYSMNLPQGMDINNRVSIENDSVRMTAMSTVHESNEFLAMVDELEVEGKRRGLDVDVTGKIPLYQANNEIVVNSFVVSMSLAIFLIAILMIIGLKSLKVGLLSVIPNSLPLLIGAGAISAMGKSLDIGTMLVGSVCLGIAVDDTIHFLTNFQKFRKQGDDMRTALGRVFTYTVPALVTTTIVLVMAFSSFIMAGFVPNQNFGIFVAIILSAALIADVLFLPSLLILVFGEKEKA